MKISAETYKIEVNAYELKLIEKALYSACSEYIHTKPYDGYYNGMVSLREQINNFLKENDK